MSTTLGSQNYTSQRLLPSKLRTIIPSISKPFELIKEFYTGDNGSFCLSDENAIRRMRFCLKLGSIAAVLLHEDLLSCNSSTGQLTVTSIQLMKSLSEVFFKEIGIFSLLGVGAKDIDVAEGKLDKACSKSHLRYCSTLTITRFQGRNDRLFSYTSRFLVAPLSVLGSEQESNAGLVIEVQLSAAVAKVVECLTEKSTDTSGNTKFDYSTVS